MPENLDQVTTFATKDVQITGVRVALQYLLNLDRQAFMPRRMSVCPTASHTRTPEGTGIIAATAP